LKEASKDEQIDFVNQVKELDKACRGGVKDYIKRAKVLLSNSAKKMNSFHDYKIEVPFDILQVKVWDDEFYELEKLGFNGVKNSIFRLMAGGLSERLGFNGIKIVYKQNYWL